MVVELEAPPTPSSSRSLRNFASRDSSRPDSPSDANGSGSGQGSLILRIKRKRGVDPVAALRIDALQSTTEGADAQQHALASTSPDDAATQARPKRRLTDRGVFRLAETVPLSSFDSPDSRKKLEERIGKLKQRAGIARSPAPTPPQPAPSPPTKPPVVVSAAQVPSSSKAKSDPAQVRYKVVSSHAKTARRSLFDTLKANNSSGSLSLRKRHRQVRALTGSTELGTRTPQSGPGSRLSPYGRPRYIDAVVESVGRGKSKKDGDGTRVRAKTNSDNEDDDGMAVLDKRFAGLLGEYLKDQDLDAPAGLENVRAPKSDSSASAESSDDSSEDDYVYDIYYRDRGGESMAASAASVGLTPSEVAGQQRSLSHSGILSAAATARAVEASGVAIAPEPMATLTGLTENDFFALDDEDEIEQGSRLVSEELLDSDDPYEEGEDEDSNDEDYYRNDYPEQEAEDDDEVEDAGWGWAGPRRQTQRRRDSDSSEEDDDEEEDDEESGLGSD